VLGVSPQEPGACDEPDDLDLLDRQVIAREEWETGGGSRVIACPERFAGCYVVVWAVVDLGFHSFFSQPLVLGRLDRDQPQSPWRGFRFLSPARGKPAVPEKEGPEASTENQPS